MNAPRDRRSKRSRRRTRLSTDQVRSRLYEGALTRFRDQGYDATSVSELTRAAGVAKGTFFNHFPTKEHILASWFLGVWDGEAARLAAAGTRGARAVVEQFGSIMSHFEEDPILAAALAARLADLPGAAGVEEGGPGPLDTVRAWTLARIRECLPVIVPIHEVADEDLAALLGGALAESLREAFLRGNGSLRPAASNAAKSGRAPRASSGAIERRAAFLLASAGILPD
jgi:AcrR family transcriptional regulator